MTKTRKFSRAALTLLMMVLTTTTAWGLNVTCRYYDNVSGTYLEGTVGGTVTVDLKFPTRVYVTANDGYVVNKVEWSAPGVPLQTLYKESGGGTPYYQAPNENGTVTAYFNPKTNNVRVRFNMNGHGAAPAVQDLHLGDKATRPTPDPTAWDAIFLGWYTNSACTTPYDFTTTLDNTLSYSVAYDSYILTIYAKWQVIGGSCGKATTWVMTKSMGSSDYDVLTISGTGAMNDYGNVGDAHAPWYHDYHGTIKTVIIEEGVTKIGSSAFQSCNALTSVIIPASVTSIGDEAFDHCTALTSVTVYATAVPTLGEPHVFDYNADVRMIYVFSDRESAYKSATYWKNYASAIYPITLGVNDAGGTLGSWTTYYNGLADVRVSGGTTIYKAALSGDKKSVTLTQVSGNIVKRGEAVLLKSSGSIKLSSAANGGTGDYTDNALRGVDYATATSTLGEGTVVY